MTTISAKDFDNKTLNQKINAAAGGVRVEHCCGQRFLGCALPAGKQLTVDGTPGNALGAYLDGGTIEVLGNAQDAVGDTMNGGRIVIRGQAGDALGYAMRGGAIYVRGDAGYRAGVHMKAYKETKPVIVIGGRAGSFLGEYLAGGLIAVLGMGCEDVPVGYFTGTGMHGGKIFLRGKPPEGLPKQVAARLAAKEDLAEIEPHIKAFAECFGFDAAAILKEKFTVLTPDTDNPYKQLYTAN